MLNGHVKWMFPSLWTIEFLGHVVPMISHPRDDRIQLIGLREKLQERFPVMIFPFKFGFIGGISPTPLKNMSYWDDDIPNIWENEQNSKPPTRILM